MIFLRKTAILFEQDNSPIKEDRHLLTQMVGLAREDVYAFKERRSLTLEESARTSKPFFISQAYNLNLSPGLHSYREDTWSGL